MSLTSEQVKEFAKRCGADIVGIGDLSRFEGAPKNRDAREIFPEAKALIGLAFRMPRGALRGVEEGTNYLDYAYEGTSFINNTLAPMVLTQLGRFIEDHGYEAVPYRQNSVGTYPEMAKQELEMSDDQVNAAVYERTLEAHSRPARPGQAAPDVRLIFNRCAYICGMGEIGYSQVFLTPEFGPRQRFAFMLTDAPLEPDPIYNGPKLCDNCRQCVRDCPGALSNKDTETFTVAGKEMTYSKIDRDRCLFCITGCLRELNPFLPKDAFKDLPDGDKIMSGEKTNLTPREQLQVQQIVFKYVTPINGDFIMMCSRGCIRGCMDHLEKKGVLKHKFHTPFRVREPWKLDND